MALVEDDNVPDDYCVNRSRVGFDLETVQIDGTVSILRGTWETAQGFLKSPKEAAISKPEEGEREGKLTGKLVSWLLAADQSEIVKTT